MTARHWTGRWVDDGPGKPRLVREWARAVAPYAPEHTGRAEIELHLRRHLESLHDALLAEPPDRAAAARVGAALAGLAPGRPEALEETVAVLGDRLLVDLGLDGVTFAVPLHRLLGALAAGCAAEMVGSLPPGIRRTGPLGS